MHDLLHVSLSTVKLCIVKLCIVYCEWIIYIGLNWVGVGLVCCDFMKRLLRGGVLHEYNDCRVLPDLMQHLRKLSTESLHSHSI